MKLNIKHFTSALACCSIIMAGNAMGMEPGDVNNNPSVATNEATSNGNFQSPINKLQQLQERMKGRHLNIRNRESPLQEVGQRIAVKAAPRDEILKTIEDRRTRINDLSSDVDDSYSDYDSSFDDSLGVGPSSVLQEAGQHIAVEAAPRDEILKEIKDRMVRTKVSDSSLDVDDDSSSDTEEW